MNCVHLFAKTFNRLLPLEAFVVYDIALAYQFVDNVPEQTHELLASEFLCEKAPDKKKNPL